MSSLASALSTLRTLCARLDATVTQLERESRRVHSQQDAAHVEEQLLDLVHDMQEQRARLRKVRADMTAETAKVRDATGHVREAGNDLARDIKR